MSDALTGESYRLQAASLESETQIHRLDRVPEWPRAVQVDHVAAAEKMDAAAVVQDERFDTPPRLA